MKVTTKTGDKGETGLFGGKRVGKDSKWIELVGQLDELQSYVGWCRCGGEAEFASVPRPESLRPSGPEDYRLCEKDKVGRGKDIGDILSKIQNDLYRMMSIVGFEMKCPKNIQPIAEEEVKFLEKYIEDAQGELKNLNKFIRPGGNELAARLHIVRTVCRRVEREFVRTKIGGEILKYLNRLSDLLFVMAYEFED